MNYRREIDGLRAVAALPVIFFHAGFDAFRGGFVGVDVFFVISGYLITGIIPSERKSGNLSLSGFYVRRARRILPALFTVMGACLVPAWLWMMPEKLEDFGESLMAVVLFVSNLLFWHESEYFSPDAEEKPLLHTCSLAVEEQYYVLYPLVIALLWFVARFRNGALPCRKSLPAECTSMGCGLIKCRDRLHRTGTRNSWASTENCAKWRKSKAYSGSHCWMPFASPTAALRWSPPQWHPSCFLGLWSSDMRGVAACRTACHQRLACHLVRADS